MENAGLSAAGSLLGESTVSNLEARTSHLQPRKRHTHLCVPKQADERQKVFVLL